MTPSEPNARAEHEQGLNARQALVDALQRTDRHFSLARLTAFGATLLTLLGALFIRVYPISVVASPLAVFLLLVLWHARTLRALERARWALTFHQHALARMDGAFRGLGDDGARYADARHPYAGDLDLFGPGSLFEALWAGRSTLGADALAGWLKAPASSEEVTRRQDAVKELAVLVAHREAFFVASPSGSTLDIQRLRGWATAPSWVVPAWLPWALGVLGASTVMVFTAWFLDQAPFWWLTAAFVAEAAACWPLGSRVTDTLEAVEQRARDLQQLGERLALMEGEQRTSALLKDLQWSLKTGAIPPSTAMKSLASKLSWADARKNQVFLPVALALMWGTQWALRLERWRQQHGAALNAWLDAAAQWEALASLAAYHAEHPADAFPVLTSAPAHLQATALGHPLVDDKKCIRNDVSLGPLPKLLMVSGSNMSGKSTYLRAIGVGTVMALMGAPVRASQMTLSPLQVGACLRVQDSLSEGMSRFAAEIARLKQVVDLSTGPLPLLFLLDEILSGTNSHDRMAGAQAVLTGLLERGSVGLVTTHDLALTTLESTLGAQVRNVHFRDEMRDGVLFFDHRLHDGVVAHSNALELMRAVGLSV